VIKSPTNLSARSHWLYVYYFQGVGRAWNNEYTAWITGTPWDFQFNELTFYIVPVTCVFLHTFRSSFNQVARLIPFIREKGFSDAFSPHLSTAHPPCSDAS
jgi:formate C-acetyltransferase